MVTAARTPITTIRTHCEVRLLGLHRLLAAGCHVRPTPTVEGHFSMLVSVTLRYIGTGDCTVKQELPVVHLYRPFLLLTLLAIRS